MARKTKLHFNRINMQRRDPRVWTASNSLACNQAERLVVKYAGKVLLETVFRPDRPQPRAFFNCKGDVRFEGNTAIIEVEPLGV